MRDNGGHAVALHNSMSMLYGVQAGDVYWAASDVGWVVGPLLYRLRAAARRLHHHHVRGQAGRHTGSRRLLAGLLAARRACAVHRTDRAARHPPAGPGSPATSPNTICRSWRPCSWPASAAIRPPPSGRPRNCASRWSIIGGRPRPAGRSPPASRDSACSRSSRAPAVGPRPATTCRRSTMTATCCRAARPATCRCACRCRRAARRRCGRTPKASAPPTWPTSPAGTAPATPASIDADGDVWVMGRTDDIINVAGHRLSTGPWRRCSPPTRTSPNAPWSGPRTN